VTILINLISHPQLPPHRFAHFKSSLEDVLFRNAKNVEEKRLRIEVREKRKSASEAPWRESAKISCKWLADSMKPRNIERHGRLSEEN
jgi:hypothetical protein